MKKSQLDKGSAEYKEGTRFIVVLTVLGLLFLSIVIYLTYLELWGKDKFMDNAFNQRQWEQEENTLRGEILDRDGERIAYSEYNAEGKQKRIYPYGSLYSHVIGYNSRVYGKSQLELNYNKNLAGMSGFTTFSLKGEKTGETLHLTVSHKLQKRASEMLGKNTGAVVAIEPATGEVLCLYSYPNFDPTDDALSKNWDSLSANENAPFLPRATRGLYAPGSTMKTIWAGAAIENGLENIEFHDEGKIEVDGKTFNNAHKKAYGDINLKQAFGVSSNAAFIELGLELGEDIMKSYAKKFMLNQNEKFELYTEPSNFGYSGKMSKTEVASAAIGQGKVLVTPLHMAMVCAAVANRGVMMQPYITEKSVGSNGIVTVSGKSAILGRVLEPSTAATLREYMINVVQNGTGKNAAISGVTVAGKTGTAETGAGMSDHSWFIGFAPAENPTIAVAVVLEHGGAGGGASAAPIAREVIKSWLQ